MKTEVGMYVRTNFCDEIVIRKIVRIVCDKPINMKYLVFDKPTKYIYYIKQNNFKASRNIIDLIEVGDILHSKNDKQYWTVENYLYEKGRCVNIEWKVLDSNEEFLENIDEIITKEQAKSVSYKVGE